jgi:hypothetical protein
VPNPWAEPKVVRVALNPWAEPKVVRGALNPWAEPKVVRVALNPWAEPKVVRVALNPWAEPKVVRVDWLLEKVGGQVGHQEVHRTHRVVEQMQVCFAALQGGQLVKVDPVVAHP